MKIIKYLWVLSLLGFLGVNLYVYALLPDKVNAFAYGNTGENSFISKSDFFYISMSILLFGNILLVLLGNLISMNSPAILPLPNKTAWVSSKENIRNLYQRFKYWLQGIGFIVNIICTAILLNFASQYIENVPNTEHIIYVGAIAFGLWILSFYPMFSYLPKEQEA